MTLRTLISAALAAAALAAGARDLQLPTVTVQGRRPLAAIGLQTTDVDSAALKENIALSMADVLGYNSSIFVKSYGRATLSTVSFRGTSPSHTKVTWNGLPLGNPMMGMTDFSTIPSCFVDRASLLHGSSSTTAAGGALGGLVELSTLPDIPREGWHAQYVQGVGSFSTFDEFARVAWANPRWQVGTRVSYASSPNDYTYINHDKKVNIYDSDRNIIGQYHPRERNRSGAYRDLNVLQEVYYNSLHGDRLGLDLWYAASNRELPLLTTDYGYETQFENRQREHTLRAVASWLRTRSPWALELRAGYTHTRMAYDYRRDVGGSGGMATMTASRSRVDTWMARGEGRRTDTSGRWMLSASLGVTCHHVRSDDRNVALDGQAGASATVGYRKARAEVDAAATARWRPVEALGLSVIMRGQSAGASVTAVPSLFVDWQILPAGALAAKASVSRNHRFPSLNDLYFMPGGNPDLKPERGLAYDAGITTAAGRPRGPSGWGYALTASATWFDSYIDDWILWLPTVKGFFSPRNVKRVHAYGIELAATLDVAMPRQLSLHLNASAAWTPSINRGAPMTEADRSPGKQLPYVPRWSASVNGRLEWRRWSLGYRWAYYSERFTQSSNEATLSGKLPSYFMSNISLGWRLPTRVADFDLKVAVNNLFDEEYLSVLSRPMPGINFEVFLGVTPRF